MGILSGKNKAPSGLFWKELCFTKKRTFMQIRDNKYTLPEKMFV